MDSNRLHYFSVVAETGSVRKAAEALRLSPAALSKAIKQLERETGLRLLVPAGRGIAITRDGRALAERARPILESLTNLATRLHTEGATTEKVVRIGSFEVFTTHFLGQLMTAIPPDQTLLLRELGPGLLERAIQEREIDLGVTYIPIPAAGVEHLKVSSIQMAAYARRDAFRGLEFRDIPFAIPVQPLVGAPNKVQGLDGWPEGRVPRRVRYRVTLMESALELCREGLAAAYLPKFVVDLHNRGVKSDRQLHPLTVPASLGSGSQAVYLVHRKEDPEDRLIRQVARALRTIRA